MTKKLGMAAAYTEVTLEEMEQYLKRSFRILRPKKGTDRGEVYYDLTLGKFVGIRVWTSIRPGSGVGAGVGQDAIRVGLISLKDKGPLEKGKLNIVKRTQGWRDSLKDRIEDLVEKYEEKDEFWEGWAETRKRQGQPEQAMREQEREEERARDEDGEGESPREVPAPTNRQYDPDKMQGGISEKQMGFLRFLMRGMSQARWESIGAPGITGLSDYPKKPSDVRGLSKGQASRLIDALKDAGASAGGARYAAEDLDEQGSYDNR